MHDLLKCRPVSLAGPGNKGRQELARAAPDMAMAATPASSAATSAGGPMAAMGAASATDNSAKPSVMDAASEDDEGGCSIGRVGSAHSWLSSMLFSTVLVGAGLRSRRRSRR